MNNNYPPSLGSILEGLGAITTIVIFFAGVITVLFPDLANNIHSLAQKYPGATFVSILVFYVLCGALMVGSPNMLRAILSIGWEKWLIILLVSIIFVMVNFLLDPMLNSLTPPFGLDPTIMPTTALVTTETPTPTLWHSPTADSVAPTPTITPTIIASVTTNVAAPATPTNTSVPTAQPWAFNGQYVRCGTVDGQVALVVQTNDGWQTYALRRTNFSVQPGQTVSFKYRLGDADQAGRFGLARQGGGFIGLIFHVSEMYPDYNLGTSKDWPIDGIAVDQRADVWYQASINVDSEGRITWEVRPENPLSVNQSIFYVLNTSATNAFFKDQRFQFYLHSGTRAGASTVYLRDYQEGGNRIVLCEGE